MPPELQLSQEFVIAIPTTFKEMLNVLLAQQQDARPSQAMMETSHQNNKTTTEVKSHLSHPNKMEVKKVEI